MKPLDPTSHRDVLRSQRLQYDLGVLNGEIVPFTYPMCTYGAAILFLFVLVPPKSPLHCRASRWLAFALVLYWHAWIILNCKGYSPACAFGVGILSAWGTLWAANLLVFQDAKIASRRVEYGTSPEPPPAVKETNGEAGQPKDASHLVQRKVKQDGRSDCATDVFRPATKASHSGYTWQPYPEHSLSHRAYWCIDLITNFRGVAWNWKVSGLPSYPRTAQLDLARQSGQEGRVEDIAVSKSGIPRFDSSLPLILHNIWLLTKGYLTIDALKTIMNHDPYFWGYEKSPPPSWLPLFIRSSVILVRGYRLFVSMSMIWMALRSVFCLAPLFFVGLVGPKILGANGESWLFPDHFGSYSNVLDRGLAGWWGGWWHQTFRVAFQEAASWTVKSLRINPRSLLGKVLQMFVAFSLSGLLHASASMTQMGDTRPLKGPYMFFFWQPVGMVAEMLWKMMLQKTGLSSKIPRSVARLANFVYVHLWFFLTGPLLTDDFAKGGLWLFEPIMLSPLRGLGFGAEGDGFFCWGEGWNRLWHQDRRWYLTGVAF